MKAFNISAALGWTFCLIFSSVLLFMGIRVAQKDWTSSQLQTQLGYQMMNGNKGVEVEIFSQNDGQLLLLGFLSPSYDSITKFNGKFNFNETDHSKIVYTFFNQRVYYEVFDTSYKNHSILETGCLPDPAKIPRLDLVGQSYFQSAIVENENVKNQVLKKQNMELDTCEVMRLATFEAEEYFLCESKDGFVFRVWNEDVFILFHSVSSSSQKEIEIPQNLSSTFHNPLNCPIHMMSSSTFTMSRFRQQRILLLGSPSSSTTECGKCQGGMKTCLFFHGAGTEVEEKDLLNEYKIYWGSKIHTSAPCCETIKFARFDTSEISWTNETLQQKYCNKLVSIDDTDHSMNETQIDNVIVVTHSMASLVLALALESKKCSLSTSSKWVSLMAPMSGSLAADELEDLCLNSSFLPVLNFIGICPPKRTIDHFYEQGGNFSSGNNLDHFYTSAQHAFIENVDAVLCGTSSYGLNSFYSPILYALDTYVGFRHENDGVVDMSSCMKGLNPSLFSNSYKSKFYLADINHVDGTFRNGDGAWGNDRKPLRWFQCLF